jgi:hypothetical protein
MKDFTPSDVVTAPNATIQPFPHLVMEIFSAFRTHHKDGITVFTAGGGAV